MKLLYPPQRTHLDILLQAHRTHGVSLDSSITGAGKTLVAVEQCRELGLSGFVVCPKSVITQWERTFAEQGVPFTAAVTWEKLRTGRTGWCLKDGRKGFRFTLPEDTAVILDEVHKGKALNSLNANMVIAARRQRIPVMALSATAAENPAEMRSLGFLLGLHNLHDFMPWARAHGCTLNQWNGLEFPVRNRKLLDKLNAQIYPQRGHKLTREDMGAFFSRTSIVTDPVDFGDRLRECYETMAVELADLAEKADGDAKGAEALTAQLRARQKVELLKVPLMSEEARDAVGEGRSVAVFLNFNDSVESLRRTIGMPCAVVVGGQTKAERDREVAKFQRDEAHVILCNVAAGGQSISLHDTNGNRPRTSLISPSWNAKDVVQALGRVDRAGAMSDTVQRVFFAADTVEEEVCKALNKKLLDLETLHAKHDITPAYSTPAQTMVQQHTPPAAPPDTPPDAHHEYGGSALKDKEKCSAFVNHGGSGLAAQTGERLHLAKETDDPSILESGYEQLLYDTVSEAENHILAHHGVDQTRMTDLREERLQLDLGLPKHLNPFGTTDRVVLHQDGRTAVQFDYKFGKVAVDDAETNPQAWSYATGVFQKFPGIQEIHFYFLQPQIDEISHACFRRERLASMVLRLNTIIQRAEEARGSIERGEDPGNLNPSESLCVYCRNVARCHAVASLVAKVAPKYEPMEVDLPEGSIHGSDMDDPALFGKLWGLVPVVEKWAAGMRQRGQEFARGAVEVPGWEAVERAGRKTITGPLAAADALKEELSLEEILSVSTVAFGELAELYASKAPPRKKAAWKAAMEEALSQADALSQAAPSYIWKRRAQ